MPLHFTPGHPAIKLKGMEYCDLTDKELKMPITKGKKNQQATRKLRKAVQ